MFVQNQLANRQNISRPAEFALSKYAESDLKYFMCKIVTQIGRMKKNMPEYVRL